MLNYEFMKQFVVCIAFVLIISVGIGGWTYWVCELVSFIRKRIKTHREKKSKRQSDEM